MSHFVDGTIIDGPYKGWRIRVENDEENTGGFLVIVWDPHQPDSGFDDWAEEFAQILKLIGHRGYRVKWDKPLETLER